MDPFALPLPAAAPPALPPPEPDLSWLDEEEPEEEYLALGPEDDDYVPADRPDVAEARATAEDLLGLHGLRIGQAREMAEAYDGDRPGFFAEDADDIADGIIETMPINTLRQMYDFRCGFLAMHEPIARLVGRDAIDRDEAMAVEELIHYDFRCEERQFARATGADLRRAEAAHLQRYGMLVGLDTLDPRDEYCGLAMTLVDPATVFPVWGGTELLEVYRVYEDDAANIAGHYGGKPGSPEYERIRGLLTRATPTAESAGTSSRLPRHTVTEVWNRDHFAAILGEGEEELAYRKHGYRRVPFTIVNGNFDLAAGTSSGTNAEVEEVPTDRGMILVNDASVDIARRNRPYDWKQLKAHRIAEAVAGRQLSTVKWAIDPHKVLEKDPLSAHKQAPIGRLLPGETTEVMLPNKLNLITPVIDPLAMSGVNMALAANAQSGILGQLASGTIPPQTSGSALNSMIEMGGAADAILVRLIELFKRMRAEFRLELRRDWGGMLGRTGDRGVIAVPSRYGQTPMHRVTPAMIRRTGCQVEVELYTWRPDVAVAQYVATLRTPSPVTGLPLISDETARRKLKATPDPDREAERIEDEQLLAMPAIARQRTIRRLKRERDQALAEGDDDSVDDAESAVLQLEYLQEQEILSGQAAAPPGAGMDAGGMAPPAMDMGPALPGTSLPAQGIGVGTEGGRPPEVPEPPPPDAMMPVGGQEGF